MEKIPMFSADLIRQLREVFPACPASRIRAMTPDELAEYCGQQKVLEYLEGKQALDDAEKAVD